jgi:cytochrome P450
MLQLNSVASDAPRHTALRRAMEPPVQRQALHEVQERIQAAADTLVENITDGDSFDAIGDIAQSLPLTVVRDMCGLPLF